MSLIDSINNRFEDLFLMDVDRQDGQAQTLKIVTEEGLLDGEPFVEYNTEPSEDSDYEYSLSDLEAEEAAQSFAETDAEFQHQTHVAFVEVPSNIATDSVPRGNWNSTGANIDLEATEGLAEKIEIDTTFQAAYDMPLDVELPLLEWMLYELDACIDNHRISHKLEGVDGVVPRGYMGPLNNVNGLVNRFEKDKDLDCHAGHRGSCYYGARDFRHAIEHREEPMTFFLINSALSIPSLLKDTACAKRMNFVYDTITGRFAREKFTCSADSTASTTDIDDDIYQEVHNMITQPLNFDYSPQLGLLYRFIDSLKLAAFKWARGTHPEHFTANDHYKMFEPTYWARKYPYTGLGAECEGAKYAFFNTNGCALKEAFEGLVEIRNSFIHRNPQITQKELDTQSSRSFFWIFKRYAVKLALMLGAVDLALEFDVNIQVLLTGKGKGEIIEQLSADDVEAAVKGLMSGPGQERQAILTSMLFCGEKAFRDQMRRRWMCINLLMEGEYLNRIAGDGPVIVQEEQSEIYKEDEDDGEDSEDMSDDTASDEPETPPTSSDESEATKSKGWDWSAWESSPT